MIKSVLSLAAVSLLLPSCGGSNYTYTGYRMHKQFPLDGDREWQYLNDADDVENPMRVEKISTPTMKNFKTPSRYFVSEEQSRVQGVFLSSTPVR